MSYALYKFHKAILSLYGTELQRKQWLASSYIHHIIHLRESDLPGVIQPEFRELRDALTKVPGENTAVTLEQTVESMADCEVNTMINLMVVIYNRMRDHEGLEQSGNLSRTAPKNSDIYEKVHSDF